MVKNQGAAWALLALIAVVASALWLDISSRHDCHEAANHCNARTYNENQPANYMAVPLAVGRFLDDHNGAVGALSSVIITAFTVVLAVSTGGLYRATRGLQDFAAQQAADTKESIAAAKRAADSASESNKITRDLFVAEQRPWVSIAVEPSGDLNLLSDGRLMVELKLTRRNSGRAPAISVISQMTLIGDAAAILSTQDEIARRLDEEIETGAGIVLFPNDLIETDIRLMVSADGRGFPGNSADRRNTNVCIVGCAKYSFPFEGIGTTRYSAIIGRSEQGFREPLSLVIGGEPIVTQMLRKERMTIDRTNIGNSAE